MLDDQRQFLYRMNILGLDYGEKHVGVALAEGPLAAPLTTLNTETAIPIILDLVVKYQIEKIIVGDCPETFLKELEELGVEVEQSDETLSSHDARQMLMHTTQTRRKEKEHAVAATIILQNWLDTGNI